MQWRRERPDDELAWISSTYGKTYSGLYIARPNETETTKQQGLLLKAKEGTAQDFCGTVITKRHGQYPIKDNSVINLPSQYRWCKLSSHWVLILSLESKSEIWFV
jgi:hypothetical protein